MRKRAQGLKKSKKGAQLQAKLMKQVKQKEKKIERVGLMGTGKKYKFSYGTCVGRVEGVRMEKPVKFIFPTPV